MKLAHLADITRDYTNVFAKATLEGIGATDGDALLNLAQRLEERARKIRESVVKCWCGAPTSAIASGVLGREWCHEHAPRCRSGAHFHGNCQCKGSQ